MNKAQIVLEYFKIILSPQIVAGVVVAIFILLFKNDIRSLILRIAKISLPGGGELLTTQLERSVEAPEKAKDEQLKSTTDSVDLPANLSLTPEQVDIVRKLFRAERANAGLWEYRYLNYFLVQYTQRVLDWLSSLESGTSLSLFSNFWLPLIPNSNERLAILNALQAHNLIKTTGEYIEITPKGREYVKWRGTLPQLKT